MKNQFVKLPISLKVFLVIFVIVFLSIALFYAGDNYAVNNLSIKTVSTTQMGSAMKNDTFYSQYRENTLIFYGQIKSVYKVAGKQIVSFNNSSPFQTSCQFNSNSNELVQGKTIKVLAEGATALRQNGGVQLKNCELL